jgi:hypothetical protein
VAQIAISAGEAMPVARSARTQRSASTASARGFAQETTSGVEAGWSGSGTTRPGNQPVSRDELGAV